MGIASCCRHLLYRYSSRHRAAICSNWILPLRLVVVVSLFGHLLWLFWHSAVFYTAILAIIHATVALLVLAECRRSVRYHQTIAEFERREAVLQGDPP